MFLSLPFKAQVVLIAILGLLAAFCLYGLKGVDVSDVSPRPRQVAVILCFFYVVATVVFWADIWITCSNVYKESTKIIEDAANNNDYYDAYLEGYYDAMNKNYDDYMSGYEKGWNDCLEQNK